VSVDSPRSRETADEVAIAPGRRGWIKTKNSSYWRRDSELMAMEQWRKRRTRQFV